MPRLTNLPTRPAGHGGGVLPPRSGGGGDGHGGDGMPDFVPDSIPNYGERLRRARMGLAVAMTPILVLFVSFTAVYIFRRAFPGLDSSRTGHFQTSIPGVSLGDERHFPWLPLTTLLGLVFLAGQLFVWSKLSSGGFHLAGGTSS